MRPRPGGWWCAAWLLAARVGLCEPLESPHALDALPAAEVSASTDVSGGTSDAQSSKAQRKEGERAEPAEDTSGRFEDISLVETEPDEKRPLPDYDGRSERHTPGRALLWVPRVLLAPAYFVSEYVVRRPLGAAITAAERAELPAQLYDFFAFGPDHKAGIVPIAFVDFGFLPSVGLYAFWDDAGFSGHDVRVRASTWGADWLSGTATERFRLDDSTTVTLTANGLRRPDHAFYGVGPDTRESARSRYAADRVEARALAQVRLWRLLLLETSVGYRGASFSPGQFDGDPSLPERVLDGTFPEPPGYQSGYRAAFSQTRLTLDSRASAGRSLSGARIELEAEHGVSLTGTPGPAWLRSSATLGGFWDLGDSGRVLGLSITPSLAEQLGSTPVPFTELVTLGGPELMPGFRDGRLRGRSALVATLRYSWPIWMWLNGSLQAAAGNVFDEQLRGFSVERSRLSAALGVESKGSLDSIFQLLVGFGTETFDSGAAINSLRITAGARSGF